MRKGEPHFFYLPVLMLALLSVQPSAAQSLSPRAKDAQPQYLNPDGLTKPTGYTQVVVVAEQAS